MIAVIAKNGAIGESNKLLWKIPEDMKYFKSKTTNHVVIMGGKTFLSMGSRLLPNRTNIILTRNDKLNANGGIISHSIEDSLERARALEKEEIFVIGGGNIYKQYLPFADRLYLTVVEDEPKAADTFFPDYSDFKKVISERPSQDENYKYKFLVLER